MWLRAFAVALGSGATMLVARPAASQEALRWHLEASGAHAVGDPQSREYGFGAAGSTALEVPIGHVFGAQLEAGGLWLPHASAPLDMTLADHGDGTALFAMLGVHLRPLVEVAGPWVDVDAGYVRTGDRDRFGFDVHAGFDWRIGGGRWDAGPFVGYLHIVQPKDTLRPEDANILALGIHVALGAERPPPPVEASVAPPRPPPPPPSPPPAPPPDRDGDGVPDADDACPDVPGIKTSDPKTNGCPAEGDQVRVIKDHIDYDDVILFDKDQAHVHHASWPILKKLAVFINAHPDFELVDITGHADERGSAEYNLRLSQERALAVKDRLVQFGVNSARLTTIGYGTARPRAEGHKESDWRQNRRVEFIITKVTNAQGGSTSIKQPEPTGQPK